MAAGPLPATNAPIVGGSAPSRAWQPRPIPELLVRALGGDQAWVVPNAGKWLTGVDVRRYLVARGDISQYDRMALVAGQRVLDNVEMIWPVLAETNAPHLTLVRCGRPWLADQRAILAGKWLQALLEKTFSPASAKFNPYWTSRCARAVDVDELQSVLQFLLKQVGVPPLSEPSVRDFVLLLGSQLCLMEGWMDRSLKSACVLDPRMREFPHRVLRCMVFWALVFSTAPGSMAPSWPMVFPRCNEGRSVVDVQVLVPTGCDIQERLGRRICDALARTRAPPMPLHGVERARFITCGSLSPPGPADGAILEESTTIAALRVCARLQARLPVVLLGDFPDGDGGGGEAPRADSEVCDLARHLLSFGREPLALRAYEVAGLAEDFCLPAAPAQGAHPVTLLQARGRQAEVSRLASLGALARDAGAAAWCWPPGMVWSVSYDGAAAQDVQAMLPPELSPSDMVLL